MRILLLTASKILRVLVPTCCVLLAGACQNIPAETESARRFLQQLYDQYQDDGPGPDLLGSAAPELFTADLLTLLQEDRRLAAVNQDTGLLDYDPVCSCQDWGALKITGIDVVARGDGQASAKVTFSNLRTVTRVRFSLLRQSGQWRILDIEDQHKPSLRQYLLEGLQELGSSVPNAE